MNMKRHREPIRRALEAFCRHLTGRDDGWHVETWLHPITKGVESVLVAPEFEGMGITQRQVAINSFLREHLADEHSVKLHLKIALTPEEYEETDWMPSYPTISLGVSRPPLPALPF